MPLGMDDEGRLDEGTLRRFVFQTYGRSRRTQDSPIMPDVWLRYIRVAEKIAHWNIVVKLQGARKITMHFTNDDVTWSKPYKLEKNGKSVANLREMLAALHDAYPGPWTENFRQKADKSVVVTLP